MITVGMSTTCVFPSTTDTAFRLAATAGFDGVEVMITADRTTRSIETLQELSTEYELPILSVHAPVLLLSQFVWGMSPRAKLEKAAELARDLGASTVVVHPPFRWQGGYVAEFLDAVREIGRATSVEIAVENMFPWGLAGRSLGIFAPGFDPTALECDAMTLDFSHAALAGQDGLELAMRMGSRLRHVHLTDGTTSAAAGRTFDEHLIPGHGTQPVAEVLSHLASTKWSGSVIAEVSGRAARTDHDRLSILSETLEFARAALKSGVSEAPTAVASDAPDFMAEQVRRR